MPRVSWQEKSASGLAVRCNTDNMASRMQGREGGSELQAGRPAPPRDSSMDNSILILGRTEDPEVVTVIARHKPS